MQVENVLLCAVQVECSVIQERDNDMKKVNREVKSNATSEKMVRAIASGNNVEAYKLLEKRMREKVAEKIDHALKDA